MANMQDVADYLGISRSTVSHVLNGRAEKLRIKKDTQDKILAAAKELGFRRNEVARSMVTGHTRIVCMLVHSLSGEYNSLCAQGVLTETNNEGMFLKMATWTTPENFRETLRHVMELQPLGLICRNINRPELAILKSETKLNPLPVVLMEDHSGCDGWSAKVCSDEVTGICAVIEHLMEKGHSKIGFLSTPLDFASHYNRFDIFKKITSDKNIKVSPDNIYWSEFEKIGDFVKEFIKKRKTLPSAVVCPSDGIAYAFMKALEKDGIKIPEDFSLTGYGNTPVARYGVPHLTTVRENYSDMGTEAFRTLVKLIDKKSQNAVSGEFNKRIPVELIIGQTTGENNE